MVVAIVIALSTLMVYFDLSDRFDTVTVIAAGVRGLAYKSKGFVIMTEVGDAVWQKKDWSRMIKACLDGSSRSAVVEEKVRHGRGRGNPTCARRVIQKGQPMLASD